MKTLSVNIDTLLGLLEDDGEYADPELMSDGLRAYRRESPRDGKKLLAYWRKKYSSQRSARAKQKLEEKHSRAGKRRIHGGVWQWKHEPSEPWPEGEHDIWLERTCKFCDAVFTDPHYAFQRASHILKEHYTDRKVIDNIMIPFPIIGPKLSDP